MRLAHSYVAIKTIYPPLLQNRKLPERFEREARQAAQFRHPNVASIYYLNTRSDRCFYAMELVDGESVEQLVERSGPVGASFALEIAAQVADALVAAEKLRLVHRDIKPSNLMLTRGEDGRPRVKIIDFGVALWLDPQTSRDAEQLTQAGLVGTAHFASPEQLRHEPLDSRSDIYSLGATLWFMLTGRSLFCGSAGEVTDKQLHSEPPLDELAQMPVCVRELLVRMLQKEPAARPETALALKEEIEECRGRLVHHRSSANAAAKIAPAKSRSRKWWLIVGAGLLAGVVIAAMLVNRRPDQLSASATQLPQGVALLPFHLITPDEQTRSMAQAIADELVANLARNKRLTVISADSANDSRLQSMTPMQKGAALGVSMLIEGNVQRTGEQYRVNARLVEARTGRTLHAATFDSQRSDLFGLQRELAQEMSEQLQPNRPYQAPPGVPTENMAAYEAYLNARECERKAENEMGSNAKQAAKFYEQAIALDPNFVLAEARLASTCARLYWQEDDWELGKSYRLKAQQAIERAMKLDPDLPEVHAALGYYYYYGHRDFDHALPEFKKAQASLPNDADVALAIALVERRKGAWEDSLSNLVRATRLDPLNARTLSILADTYNGLRRYDDAERVLARAVALKPQDTELGLQRAYVEFEKNGNTAGIRDVIAKLDPGHASDNGEFARWEVNILERKFEEAVRDIEQSPLAKFEVDTAIYPKELLCGLSLWLKGDLKAARPYFEQAKAFIAPEVEKGSGGARLRVALALACAGLGQKDQAVQQARLATEERGPNNDAVGGPPIAISVARVYLIVGDRESAAAEVKPLLSMPFGLSGTRARVEPWWDALRDREEFRKGIK